MAASGIPPETLDDLVERTVRYLALVALTYRVVGQFISIAGIVGSRTFGPIQLGELVAISAVVLVTNLAFVITGLLGWLPRPTRLVFGIDVAIAVALNLWASTLIPPETVFFDYRNPFGVYASATLALWTGIKGPRAGLVLLAGFAGPLHLGMAALNYLTVYEIDWPKFASRGLWLVVAFVVPHLMMLVARRGAEALATESERAGRLAERAAMLRSLHDTVLQTLLGIAQCAGDPASDTAGALRDVGAAAQRQAVEVQAMLRIDQLEWEGLYAELERLVADIEGRGAIRARFVPQGTEPELRPDAQRSLVGAVGEALRNTERHARAEQVTVYVEREGRWVRAVVRDDGCGFDETQVRPGSFGIMNSIRARIAEAGGQAWLTSSPGKGTTWELRVPVHHDA